MIFIFFFNIVVAFLAVVFVVMQIILPAINPKYRYFYWFRKDPDNDKIPVEEMLARLEKIVRGDK